MEEESLLSGNAEVTSAQRFLVPEINMWVPVLGTKCMPFGTEGPQELYKRNIYTMKIFTGKLTGKPVTANL